ncbi:MAG TPA: sulfurtransferase [Candidimonas sp.]|nr:sulfurtransferase [Candidimonas sp.]
MPELLISAESLAGRVQAPDILVFDVRHDLADHQAGRAAYDKGHIPGAIYLDHERQLSGQKTGLNGRHPLPDRASFAALIRGLGLRPQTTAIIYDNGSSAFSAHLWWMLRWIGHEKILVLDGGWLAWQSMGGAVETTPHGIAIEAPVAIPELAWGPESMPTVDAAAVLQNISTPVFTVVDARSGERFRGEAEPIDPVAGRIPGAVNRPNSDNLQSDGRFKTAAQLRREFSDLLGDVPADQVVHQCGSGITASHNLFAMTLAGMPGSALYPGSWSEWCSDPSRPVARG